MSDNDWPQGVESGLSRNHRLLAELNRAHNDPDAQWKVPHAYVVLVSGELQRMADELRQLRARIAELEAQS